MTKGDARRPPLLVGEILEWLSPFGRLRRSTRNDKLPRHFRPHSLVSLACCFLTALAASGTLNAASPDVSSDRTYQIDLNGETVLRCEDLSTDSVRFLRRGEIVSENVRQGAGLAVSQSRTAERLTLKLSLKNTSPDPITGWVLNLGKTSFATSPKGFRWEKGLPVEADNLGGIAMIPLAWEASSLAICLDEGPSPAVLRFSPPQASIRSLILTVFSEESPLNPGDSREIVVSFRVYPSNTPPAEVFGDLYQRFATTHPRTIAWDDRRPIGMLALSSTALRSATNPNGWLIDPTIDGPEALQRQLLEAADRTVAILLSMHAQGMIFWDLEGSSRPELRYAGDPTKLPTLAAELDAVADEFFARFTRAGLRTGVCVRPSRLTPGRDGQLRHELVGVDGYSELDKKIAYSRRRWECTLFYVDSPVQESKRAGGTVARTPLDPNALDRLHSKYPDVLLIPENPLPQYWASSAPYIDFTTRTTGTPDGIKAIWPGAFSVINVAAAPVQEKQAELTSSVRQGDILLFRCWYDAPENKVIRGAYERADRK